MLIPAMRRGEPLHISPPLSAQLCFRLPRIRDIFHTWYPGEFSRIAIHTTPRECTHDKPQPRAATFFSGGVDSFYTLLKHRSGCDTLPVRLTDIIFVRGVETRLHPGNRIDESERWSRDIAAEMGVGCIVGETNIRTCLQGPDTYINWEDHYHGSALAAIASAVSFKVGYVCISAPFPYTYLIAHGATPLLDEMYSTERVNVIHDGSEAGRAAKVAKILEWDRELILSRLRVCIETDGGAFNCGKCRKCVRTAITLRVLGVWQQARTFPDKSTDHWETVLDVDHVAFTEDNLAFAIAHGAAPELIAMLQRVVQRKRRRAGLQAFVRNSPLNSLRPVVRRLRKPFASSTPASS
jgi:hypothetical protein